MGITVEAPDGRTRHVSRRLHWPHWRGWDDDGPGSDLPIFDFGDDSLIGGILLAATVVLLVAS